MPTQSKRASAIVRFAVATLSLFTAGTAISGSATLSWTAPTENEDGTPLTDLASFNIYQGCTSSGQYELPPILGIPSSITSVVSSALPEGGNCYFVATAVNDAGVESSYSNQAIKFIPPTEPPPYANPVESLSVTWQESAGPPVMAAPTHQASDLQIISPGNGSSITATWPTNLADGDLVIAVIFMRGSYTITTSEMTELGESTFSNTTMQVFYHLSDGNENGTFTITGSGADSYCGFTARVTGAADPSTTAPTLNYDGADTDEGQGDPPNHTFTSGDYLIFAAAGKRDAGDLDGGEPTGYSNVNKSRDAAEPAAMGFADKQVTGASSENPGTIGWSGIADWTAVTLAIPASGGTTTTLTADPGALTLAGAAATLRETDLLTATPGALLLTGSDATLSVAQLLAADPGALQLTGANAALLLGLASDPGALLLTGAEATLSVADLLAADPGALQLVGADADLTEQTNLAAGPGALLLTGADATLEELTPGTLTADPGALTLTGADATLVAPVLVQRRGGVRWIYEEDPEKRAAKVEELAEVIKPELPATEPQEPQETLLQAVQRATSTMPPAKQTRIERLLSETGISLKELLDIISS